MPDKKATDRPLDLIQKTVGDFGRWQLTLCVCMSLLELIVACKVLSIMFLAPPVIFTCTSDTAGQNLSNETTDQCLTGSGEECTVWEYDRSVFEETIVTEWNLVCSKAQLANVAQTIFMLGVLLGSFIFGMASDRFGRKVPLICAICIQVVAGIITSFVPWYSLLLLCRLIDALAAGGQLTIGFVLCMEILSPKYRTRVAVLYHISFTMGHTLLPVFSYYLRDWRNFQLAMSSCAILYLSYWWILPESPRWLLTMGREKEALEVLEKAARLNRLDPSQVASSIKQCRLEEASDKSRRNMLDLVKTRNMRIKSFCIFFNWFVCGLGFYGLAQYMGHIGGNIFFNVAISGLLELPGTFICLYFMQKFGRKPTLAVSQLLAGIFCLFIMATPLGPGAPEWPRVTLSALGLLSMSVSFPTAYIYAVELFPTVVRNVGVGSSSMCSRVGSMIAPFVSSFSTWSVYYPPLTFGVLPILAAAACYFLPETANAVLPNTMEEGEKISRKSQQNSKLCNEP